MKLQHLQLRVRSVPLSSVRMIDDDDTAIYRSTTAHLRLRGRALQTRNARIARRDMYTCQICRRVADTHEGQVDHRTALVFGGTDDDNNLQWICTEPCHRLKTQRENAQRRSIECP